MVSKRRLGQLKFVTNIFNLSLKEIKETLGPETLTMIFRRVGETSGENIAKRLKGKFGNIKEFCNLIVTQIMDPVVGVGKCAAKVQDNKVIFELLACPYKKAGGFPIKEMSWFCHYTEGLLDIALKTAFPDKNFETFPKKLKAEGADKCVFEISI